MGGRREEGKAKEGDGSAKHRSVPEWIGGGYSAMVRVKVRGAVKPVEVTVRV